MKQANGSPERQLATVILVGLTILYLSGWVSNSSPDRRTRMTTSVAHLDHRNEAARGIVRGNDLLSPRIINPADITKAISADPVISHDRPTVSTGLCGEAVPGYHKNVCWGNLSSTLEDNCMSPWELVHPTLLRDDASHLRGGQTPVPLGPGWRNFSAAEARSFLKGRTLVFAGDSTSRRLMWSLCIFLVSDTRAWPEPDMPWLTAMDTGLNGGKDKSIHKYCDIERLAQVDDIVLLETPFLHAATSVERFNFAPALCGVRGDARYWNGSGDAVFGGSLTRELSAKYPPLTSTTASTHFFSQVAMTYHDSWCLAFLPGPGEWIHNQKWTPDPGTDGNCDGHLFFTSAVNDILATSPPPSNPVERLVGGACALVASFFDRSRVAKAAGAELGHALFFHALLFMPAGISLKPRPFSEMNIFSLALAAVAQGQGHCHADLERLIREGGADTVDQFSWLLPGNASVRATAWEQALRGDIVGANTTLSSVQAWPRGWERSSCATSDGFTPHVYDHLPQAIRVQLALNSVWRDICGSTGHACVFPVQNS